LKHRCADQVTVHANRHAGPPAAKPVALTRCACAEMTFEQIANLADREGIETFPFLCKRTGCCSTCTACGPDLKAFLDARNVRTEDSALTTA